MLNIALADGKPVQYRNFIRNRFALREVIVSPVPLAEDHDTKHEYAAAVADAKGATQDRRTCCGTMNHPEYQGDAEALDDEYRELKKAAGTRRERPAA